MALGLQEPWSVTDVRFEAQAKEIHFDVSFKPERGLLARLVARRINPFMTRVPGVGNIYDFLSTKLSSMLLFPALPAASAARPGRCLFHGHVAAAVSHSCLKPL